MKSKIHLNQNKNAEISETTIVVIVVLIIIFLGLAVFFTDIAKNFKSILGF